MTTLRTPRLVLRGARPSDLHALHAVLSDVEAMRYWSTAAHRSLATTEAWLCAMIDADGNGEEDFVIEHEGEVVGKVGFFRLPEIGFILRRDLWGRGIVGEAAAAVVAHVLATRAVEELVADVDPRNAASLRVLARLGFVETSRAERTMCIDGVWTDSVYLRLRR